MFGSLMAMFSGRDPRWYKESRGHLKSHPKCVCCGQDASEVHHVKPVSVAPDLEMVASNWASVCERCHFTVGHLNNWQKWNGMFWETVALARQGMRSPTLTT